MEGHWHGAFAMFIFTTKICIIATLNAYFRNVKGVLRVGHWDILFGHRASVVMQIWQPCSTMRVKYLPPKSRCVCVRARCQSVTEVLSRGGCGSDACAQWRTMSFIAHCHTVMPDLWWSESACPVREIAAERNMDSPAASQNQPPKVELWLYWCAALCEDDDDDDDVRVMRLWICGLSSRAFEGEVQHVCNDVLLSWDVCGKTGVFL